jgi:arylsulfatase A-like enzyme
VGAKTGAEQVRAAYDGEVWFTDSQIGRILDYIQAQKYAKETVIVVSSDHGEAFGDHGMSFHGFEIWESLARVPLIIHVPGVTPHHVPNKRSQIDLVPTILDLLRIAPPPKGELSGRSLMDDLFPSEPGKFAERDVYIDMPIGPYTGMRRALIHGDGPGMKLIHSGGNLYQLFDLATDPEEKLDLSKDKEKLAPMIEAMQRKRATMHELDVKPRAAN